MLLAFKGLPNDHQVPDFENCYINGLSYRGTANTTTDGYSCQHWNDAAPWNHGTWPEKYLPAKLEENYCRFPLEDIEPPFSQPYCWKDDYTVDPSQSLGTCGVPKCSFSVCPAGTFQCMDGQCIPSSSVCDGKVDCALRTDELSCGNNNKETNSNVIESKGVSFENYTPYKLTFKPSNPADSHQVSVKIQQSEVSLIKFELEEDSCLTIISGSVNQICNDGSVNDSVQKSTTNKITSKQWIVGDIVGESGICGVSPT